MNSLSKTDKLSMAPSVDAVEEVPVETIKIAPVPADVQEQPEATLRDVPKDLTRDVPKTRKATREAARGVAREVVSWHWHVGSKITKRISER